MFGKAIPVLRVTDLEIALRYYEETLGFALNWKQEYFASVSRGNCTIFFCVGDQGHAGTWVWIGMPDVGQLREEFPNKGAVVRNPPTNYPRAYEMQISDPDGHVLRFGSGPLRGQPFNEFLDMRGKLWPVSDLA